MDRKVPVAQTVRGKKWKPPSDKVRDERWAAIMHVHLAYVMGVISVLSVCSVLAGVIALWLFPLLILTLNGLISMLTRWWIARQTSSK